MRSQPALVAINSKYLPTVPVQKKDKFLRELNAELVYPDLRLTQWATSGNL